MAVLVRASHADAAPTDDERDIWRQLTVDARREHDVLRGRVAELEAELPLPGWELDQPVYRLGSAKV